MNAQLTVISAKRAADQFLLADKATFYLGRAPENDIVIQEPSVSRQHAKLVYSEAFWLMSDLNSMNGLRSQGIQQQCCLLEDGSIVVVGNVPVLFNAIEPSALLRQQQYDDWRVQQAAQLNAQALSNSKADLQHLLSEALKLCQMQRAALLLGSDLTSLKLHCSLGVSKEAQDQASFFGSVGALQSVLNSQQPLVANDISQHQALSQRASIKLKQLSATACLPLLCQGKLFGLFYVDSQQPSKYLSALDFELLQTLVNNLTLTLFSQQLDEELQKFSVNNRQFS
ncbi:FHA domain-containing protein [Rheinheimera sp. UJ51]|uniref:GAF domain-containing protein n=1 Tax=Rheinheimera sp. UJ51 TaxID=2892446 RepID=UPI001E4BDD74|nr:GAF domain-containing protein [Rheinheimera sp. UJ51]MCC5452029.1 FHA domain-containing protein [Rheinheimera sp. UJ51]